MSLSSFSSLLLRIVIDDQPACCSGPPSCGIGRSPGRIPAVARRPRAATGPQRGVATFPIVITAALTFRPLTLMALPLLPRSRPPPTPALERCRGFVLPLLPSAAGRSLLLLSAALLHGRRDPLAGGLWLRVALGAGTDQPRLQRRLLVTAAGLGLCSPAQADLVEVGDAWPAAAQPPAPRAGLPR